MVGKFSWKRWGKYAVDQGLGFEIKVNQPKNAFWSQITEDLAQTDFRNSIHLFSYIMESPKEGCLIERSTSLGLGFHFSAFSSTLLSSMGQLLSSAGFPHGNKMAAADPGLKPAHRIVQVT